MKLWEIVKDTFRECLGKKILISYFLISTLGILGLMFIFNVDIAGNSAAISTLFGKEQGNIALSTLQTGVIKFHGVFAAALYSIGIFLSLFSTADIIPSMMTKGRVELYLARPISRATLILGKFAGATLIIAVNIIYAIGGIWIVMGVKTGIWNINFLYAVPAIIIMFASLYTIMMLVGLLSKNTAVTIIVTYFAAMITPVLANRSSLTFITSDMLKWTLDTLYWITPKYAEFAIITNNLVTGESVSSWTPAISSILIAIVALNISVYIFSKKDL